MNARGKFGEHERSVRVARGAAERNSSFLSTLQTSQFFLGYWKNDYSSSGLIWTCTNSRPCSRHSVVCFIHSGKLFGAGNVGNSTRMNFANFIMRHRRVVAASWVHFKLETRCFQGPLTLSTSSTKEENDMEPHVTEKRKWVAQGEN